MGNKLLLGAVLFMTALIFIASGVQAKGVDLGPETLNMKTPAAKKPAVFPHRTHQKIIGCAECHHIFGEIMTTDSCLSCHNKELSDLKLNNLKKAAHARCRGCHKKLHKQGNEKVPVKCSGCHPYVPKK